jgi:hypothetical protein
MFQPRLSLEEQRKRTARRRDLEARYENALLRELIFAADFNLCVSPSCSTCGSLEFVENVFRCVTTSDKRFSSSHTFLEHARRPEVQIQIARALAALNPPEELSFSIEPPARLLILAAHYVLRPTSLTERTPNHLRVTLVDLLGSGWASTVLKRMEKHYDLRLALREQRREIDDAMRNRRALEREQLRILRQHRKEVRDNIFHRTGEKSNRRDEN